MEQDKKNGIADESKISSNQVLQNPKQISWKRWAWVKNRDNKRLDLVALVTILIVFLFFHSTPPKTIIMTSGDDDSMFYKIAGNMPRYWPQWRQT